MKHLPYNLHHLSLDLCFNELGRNKEDVKYLGYIVN